MILTEQVEQNHEQRTNESKPVAEWSMDEVRAEIKRLDQLDQESPPPRASSEAEDGRRTTFTDARTGEEIVNEVGATRRDLIRQFEALEEDSRFNDDHRAEQMWAAYDKAKPKIEEQAAAARETLLSDADRLELASIPFPGGQSLRTDSVVLLSLTQGERARIVERLSYEHPNIARMKAAGKKVPASAEDRPQNILREEYARGLATGGPAGGAICRAVIGLAEDRGMDVDSIVGEHRRDWQQANLEKAQQARIQARSVYSKVPMPSSPRPGGPRSLEEVGAGKRRTPYGVPKKSSGPTFPKRKKRPNWK